MTTTELPAAPPDRRAPARRRGRAAAALHVVVGLALAAGAIWVQSLDLTGDDQAMPLTYAGGKGEEVDAGRFSVRVDKVSTAKAVKAVDDTVATDQLFLVVDAAATSPRTPLHLGMPTLLTADGRRFAATDKINKDSTLAYYWIQPGWWARGRFVFEVPASALPGAQAVFGLPVAGLYTEPLPPEAQIDLGIDDAAARRLSSAPAEIFDLNEKP